MAIDARTTPVYLPLRTLLDGIDLLREGLPNRIDASVFAPYSTSVRSHLLSAFRFLGLIDQDGGAEESLVTLLNDRPNFIANFRAVIERAYSDVIDLAKQNASQRQLEDVMRGYGVQGATLQKAVRFYLQAAEYAGLPVSYLWRKTKPLSSGPERRRSSATRRRERAYAPSSGSENGLQAHANGLDSEDAITLRFESDGGVALHIGPAISRMNDGNEAFVLALVDRLIDKVREYEAAANGQKPANEA